MSEFGVLKINELRQRVKLGCCEKERAHPQLVTIDLTFGMNLSKCVASDNIEDTCDYLNISDSIESLLTENSWNLLETLTNDVAGHLLSRFNLMTFVEVRITKNVLDNNRGFVVTIKKER